MIGNHERRHQTTDSAQFEERFQGFTQQLGSQISLTDGRNHFAQNGIVGVQQGLNILAGVRPAQIMSSQGHDPPRQKLLEVKGLHGPHRSLAAVLHYQK
jgi:hypothetical protein